MPGVLKFEVGKPLPNPPQSGGLKNALIKGLGWINCQDYVVLQGFCENWCL